MNIIIYDVTARIVPHHAAASIFLPDSFLLPWILYHENVHFTPPLRNRHTSDIILLVAYFMNPSHTFNIL